MSLKESISKLSSGFFSFRVVNRRVSFLVLFLIIGLGAMSLRSIPKESNPKIEFGIILITTVDIGVNPVDMDTLVTDKIEQAIEDIDGIKKITSTSSVGVANTTVELENEANVNDVLVEIKDEIDKVDLPEDAQEPVVTELSTSNEEMFQLTIYGDEEFFPKQRLIDAGHALKSRLEGTNGITSIDFVGSDEYDLQILVNKERLTQLNISLAQIASAVQAYNRNIPLGQYEVDDFEYDFRIQGEIEDIDALRQIPVITSSTSTVTLGDVATIRRKYDDETVTRVGLYNQNGFNAVSLIVNKREGTSIFSSAASAKAAIEDLFGTQRFSGMSYLYSNDLSEIIQEDYQTLGSNGIQTLIFVFLCLLLFVGLKESIIATLGIPLAFFVTFFVLDQIDLSLNFLTNFSLVLTLGIAIDTSIVVIEAAYEKMKLGFNPKTAVMMAVRDFKKPLIAGTSTTIVVFIPMMVLPGVTGKFLAYIPITVFITLIAALFIALTINAAMFYRLNRKKKRYIPSEKVEKFLTEEDSIILQHERSGKEEKDEGHLSRKQRILEGLNNRYEGFLRGYLKRRATRVISVLGPVILLVLSFIFLSPRIGFTLFPSGDNERFTMVMETKVGTTTDVTKQRVPIIEKEMSTIEELKLYTISVNKNTITVNVELIDKNERKKNGQRDVFQVESDTLENLSILEQSGLTVESSPESGGPPQGKPVAVKLIADSSEKFALLMEVAQDFKAYLRTVEGTKNVGISSQETPGQFIYEFDEPTLSRLGLTPNDIFGELSAALNGRGAGSIKLGDQDVDIKVLFEDFADNVTPSAITNVSIPTRAGAIKVGEVLTYTVDNAVAEIAREDRNILVTVDADLTDKFKNQGRSLQAQLTNFAEGYSFPDGISFSAGGETEENADLINATVRGFFVAFFLIFVILVLQFNSYRKPTIIMYSILCAMLGVNIGLYLTGNPYSMPFAIGFIALTGIVVNDAIVLIDRIRENMSHDVDVLESIVEAGRSRLQPIILTTLTTLLGVLPISLQDEFREGLGFTLIFGLFAGSAMTLFVIPSLYYMVFIKKKKRADEQPE